jgi:hypothetical protein
MQAIMSHVMNFRVLKFIKYLFLLFLELNYFMLFLDELLGMYYEFCVPSATVI